MKRFDNFKFAVQEKKKLRVILDTDAACEADDPFAIVQALLTPRFHIKGIVAELFANDGSGESVDQSYEVIQKILSLMEIEDVQVYHGSYKKLEQEQEIRESEGADFIIKEARKDSEEPLYVLCMGALTNVAIALNKAPDIADKFICIWIGGGFYPDGGWEFNLTNDIHAANAVFKSQVELWQVPMETYCTMQIGYAELQQKIRPCGAIGRYLFEQMVDYGMRADWVAGESWSLGDSPSVALALNPGCGWHETRKAPVFEQDGRYAECDTNREIRVYKRVDSRYVLEDLFCKLAIFANEN